MSLHSLTHPTRGPVDPDTRRARQANALRQFGLAPDWLSPPSAVQPRPVRTRRRAGQVAPQPPALPCAFVTDPLETLPPPRSPLVAHALRELHETMRRPGMVLNNPDLVRDYCCLEIGAAEVEVFLGVFMDAQLRVVACEEQARGTIDQVAVYPREIVKAALRHGAVHMVVAHNHPSGSTRPSRGDIELTDTLRRALGLVGVRLLDHIVVGGVNAVSLAAEGLL